MEEDLVSCEGVKMGLGRATCLLVESTQIVLDLILGRHCCKGGD